MQRCNTAQDRQTAIKATIRPPITSLRRHPMHPAPPSYGHAKAFVAGFYSQSKG
ncbi:hypothetical protein [Thalassospira lucentensis]|uniref:hypothetical protein n=1 Tax=Thalassospira lucentensis TaxID=168935 RepID=UPI002943A980|nr:hypothetical protein [Thalassospira lucentensis]WOI10814.1 hypothetical protein R1T41_20180 [Thalassospira lucentensis]